MLSKEELLELFEYRNGRLFCKKDISKFLKKGAPVGTPTNSGALRFAVNGRTYAVHRVIWMMHTDKPLEDDDIIKFKDGNRYNCRIENMEVTKERPVRGGGSKSSQHKGVHYHKQTGKWHVRLAGMHIGTYLTEEQAAEVARSSAERLSLNAPTRASLT